MSINQPTPPTKKPTQKHSQDRMERLLGAVRLALLDADRLRRCLQFDAVEVQMERLDLLQGADAGAVRAGGRLATGTRRRRWRCRRRRRRRRCRCGRRQTGAHVHRLALELRMAGDLEVVLLLADERIVRAGEVEALIGVDAIVRHWSARDNEWNRSGSGIEVNVYN